MEEKKGLFGGNKYIFGHFRETNGFSGEIGTFIRESAERGENREKYF